MNLDTLVRLNSSSLASAAIEYALLGWRIFPLFWNGSEAHMDGKKPLVKWGKEATDDIAQIEAWWKRWPNANIGLVCGEAFWALDVDRSRNGLVNLSYLQSQHGTALEQLTLKSRTGGGGFHLLWRMPQGRGIKNTSDDDSLLPGLDTRGRGGYIVLPPSVHGSGRKYQWEHVVEPANAPDWLLDLVMAPTEEEKKKAGYVRSPNVWRGGEIYEGRRTNVLFSTACSQLSRGIPPSQIAENIHAINHQHCRPRLDEEYIDKNILAGALSKDPGFVQTEVGVSDWIADNIMRESWCWAKMGEGRVGSGNWYQYSGVHWAPKSELDVQAIVCDAIRSFQRRDNETLQKFGMRLEKQHTIEAITRSLRMKLPLDMLRFSDIHNRHLLALANQTTLVFHKGGEWEIRPSSHKDYLSGCLPVGYDKDAECPTWDRVLSTWLREDEATVAAVWRWMAAVLSSFRIDKLFLAVGPTRSGKTTFANALRHLLGDLATTLPTPLITKGRGQDSLSRFHKENLKTELFGKRLGVFSESALAAQLDVEMVKGLTGGEAQVTAKYMGRDPFKFVPMFQLLLHTNSSPDSKGVDNALVERLMFIEWGDTIPEHLRDSYLEEKMWNERSGVLNRILKAYEELARETASGVPQGLGLPERVRKAVEVYQTGTPEQSFDLWLKGRGVQGSASDYVRSTVAWKDYKLFCDAEGLLYLGKMDFYRKMERVFHKTSLDGYAVFRGARLPEEPRIVPGDVIITRN